MLPPVYNTLHGDAAVVALVGDRIYRHGRAPQDVAHPYLTWFLVVGTPENTLSERPGMDRMQVQVDVWHGGANGDKKVEQLAEAVRDAIEPWAHMVSQPVDEREAETRLWRQALVFDWFIPRTLAD
jgi:hypothetical protein